MHLLILWMVCLIWDMLLIVVRVVVKVKRRRWECDGIASLEVLKVLFAVVGLTSKVVLWNSVVGMYVDQCTIGIWKSGYIVVELMWAIEVKFGRYTFVVCGLTRQFILTSAIILMRDSIFNDDNLNIRWCRGGLTLLPKAANVLIYVVVDLPSSVPSPQLNSIYNFFLILAIYCPPISPIFLIKPTVLVLYLCLSPLPGFVATQTDMERCYLFKRI